MFTTGKTMTDHAKSDRRGMLFAVLTALIFIAACSLGGGDGRIVRAADQLFRVVTVAEGLKHPWGLAFLPDQTMLVTERPGTLRRVDGDGGVSEPLDGLADIAAVGQGGLLDVVLHPNFENNSLLYLSYAAEVDGKYGTRVARARLGEQALEQFEVIFDAVPKFSGGRHFGSRLLFDNDGYLFITLGDRGHRPNGQDLSTHPGSIVRINDDGSVPADNPFVDHDGARPEIWSYGHRNPQGMAIDRSSGRIWAHEHGPRGGDELNLIVAGANFGWADISFGAEYGSGQPVGEATESDATVAPLWYWDPSIAPSGLAYVDNDRYEPWQDSLLVGALKFELVARLTLDANAVTEESRFLDSQIGRVRDVRIGPDGLVYLLSDSNRGGIFRLEPM